MPGLGMQIFSITDTVYEIWSQNYRFGSDFINILIMSHPVNPVKKLSLLSSRSSCSSW